MKKYTVLVILLIVTQNTFGNAIQVTKKSLSYHLQCFMPIGYNKKKVFLQIQDWYSLKNFKRLDSSVVKNNTVIFEGTIDKECERASLWIQEENGAKPFYMQFLIDQGSNCIKVKKIGSEYYLNKLYNIEIPTSRTNRLYKKEDSLYNVFNKKYAIINEQDKKVSYLPFEKLAELTVQMLDLIRKHPDNFYSLIYIRSELSRMRNNEETLYNIFKSLNDRIKRSELGAEVDSLLKERIKNKTLSDIGKQVPEFTVKTFEGKIFDNKVLSGHPYMLIFSATWCMPCQKQLPLFVKLYDSYKEKGLNVVYFNLDNNVNRWAEHIKKNRLTWINVSERTIFKESKIATQFHVYAIPNCFLIDKTGKIVYNSDQMDRDLSHLEDNIKIVLE